MCHTTCCNRFSSTHANYISHMPQRNAEHTTQHKNTKHRIHTIHTTCHTMPYIYHPTHRMYHMCLHTVHSRYIHIHPSITHKTFRPFTQHTDLPSPPCTHMPSIKYIPHTPKPQPHHTATRTHHRQCNTNTQIHKHVLPHTTHLPPNKVSQ